MGHIRHVLATGDPIIYEYELPIGDQPRQFEGRMVPSGPDEVISIIRDITELKKMRGEAFALAVERERAKVLNRFVENASHEIRTPFAILSSVFHLLTKSDDPVKRKHYNERGMLQIRRLMHLLDTVLTMTKLDSSVPVAMHSCDFNALVHRAVDNRLPDVRQKCLDLEFIPDRALPTIEGNCMWLHEALAQLLDNAIRFTPEDGLITVTTTFEAHTNTLLLTIRDTGQGISAEALPHIFERFWRDDQAHSTPGFGLGLPIVEAIVALHKGHISVQSEVAVGTTFTVRLLVA
jgi:signal transduction histidine kinase